MSESRSHPRLAFYFRSLEEQTLAVTQGMWFFLVTEVMFFGGLFAAYILYRYQNPEAFAAASGKLDITMGAINTAVLIASSLTMVLGVWAAQNGKKAQTISWLSLTMLLGATFLVIKGFEYNHKWHEHLVPGPDFQFEGFPRARMFFHLYFAMTGLHALHMVIGLGLVAHLIPRLLSGEITSEWFDPVEIVGLYWHFVDLVWIFLFPLLYLLHHPG